MPTITRRRRTWLPVVVAASVIALAASAMRAQAPPQNGSSPAPAEFTVDASIALHSFMSLTDMHLQKIADDLGLVAATEAARAGRWERIRVPLARAAKVNVPAVYWFARPDGAYWTITEGRVQAKLADRPYFPRVLSGQTIVGELVVSRSTGRNTAIVAVPVRSAAGRVVGVLGASVHLDSLSAQLRREIGGLEANLVFFAIDAKPLGAVHSDSTLIFAEPMKLGDEGMRQAFTRMLASTEGVVHYDFRGGRRTVIYHKSPVTGWWYGFGLARPERHISNR